MPDRTPNARASYDAVATTCRGRRGSPSPATTTGRPESSGRRSPSTAARNWSRSTCRIQSAMGRCDSPRLDEAADLAGEPLPHGAVPGEGQVGAVADVELGMGGQERRVVD